MRVLNRFKKKGIAFWHNGVWRGSSSHKRLTFNREVVSFQGKSVMFSCAKMYGRSTPLIFIEETMRGAIYTESIIEPIL